MTPIDVFPRTLLYRDSLTLVQGPIFLCCADIPGRVMVDVPPAVFSAMFHVVVIVLTFLTLSLSLSLSLSLCLSLFLSVLNEVLFLSLNHVGMI